MHIGLSILIILVLSFSVFAQDKNDDIQQISTTIQNYFDGYIYRDLDKLNKAFDTDNGAMKIPEKSEAGSESVENAYFKELMPKWAGREKLPKETLDQSALKILSLDVVEGKMAVAKISMKVGETTYIDMLSLQKFNNNWKITNKMFVVMDN